MSSIALSSAPWPSGASSPAPEADRRTLIRRVSLDLVGLPPTPEETEEFVADSRPDAYDRLVDRLLGSPHYGERMAVPWLDLARFADSVGYHGDQLENNFPYREYVIAAFNRNEPFDQFTREQLAGDLLPDATAEQRVASGFNRLNMMTREGGAQAKEYLAKYAADRVRTVSTVWLGSTMACCECHDHKFDPFKTRDFYSLEAYFADIKQYGVYRNYSYTPEPELEGFNNDSPFPPEIEVKSAYWEERQERFSRAPGRACRLLGPRPIGRTGRTGRGRRLGGPSGSPPTGRSRGLGGGPDRSCHGHQEPESRTAWADGSLLISELPGKRDDTKKGTDDADPPEKMRVIDLGLSAPAGPAAAFRIEVLPDPAHAGRVTSGAKDFFTISNVTLALQRPGEDRPQPLALAAAYADRETDSYVNGQLRASLIDGWTSKKRSVRDPQSVVYLLAHPMVARGGRPAGRLLRKPQCRAGRRWLCHPSAAAWRRKRRPPRKRRRSPPRLPSRPKWNCWRKPTSAAPACRNGATTPARSPSWRKSPPATTGWPIPLSPSPPSRG